MRYLFIVVDILFIHSFILYDKSLLTVFRLHSGIHFIDDGIPMIRWFYLEAIWYFIWYHSFIHYDSIPHSYVLRPDFTFRTGIRYWHSVRFWFCSRCLPPSALLMIVVPPYILSTFPLHSCSFCMPTFPIHCCWYHIYRYILVTIRWYVAIHFYSVHHSTITFRLRCVITFLMIPRSTTTTFGVPTRYHSVTSICDLPHSLFLSTIHTCYLRHSFVPGDRCWWYSHSVIHSTTDTFVDDILFYLHCSIPRWWFILFDVDTMMHWPFVFYSDIYTLLFPTFDLHSIHSMPFLLRWPRCSTFGDVDTIRAILFTEYDLHYICLTYSFVPVPTLFVTIHFVVHFLCCCSTFVRYRYIFILHSGWSLLQFLFIPLPRCSLFYSVHYHLFIHSFDFIPFHDPTILFDIIYSVDHSMLYLFILIRYSDDTFHFILIPS